MRYKRRIYIDRYFGNERINLANMGNSGRKNGIYVGFLIVRGIGDLEMVLLGWEQVNQGFSKVFVRGIGVSMWISYVELWITCKLLQYWKRLLWGDLWISEVD